MAKTNKRGRPKKMEQVVTTNIKVTKATHARLRAFAENNGLNMSDTIDMLIKEHDPDIDRDVERKEQLKQKLGIKSRNTPN